MKLKVTEECVGCGICEANFPEDVKMDDFAVEIPDPVDDDKAKEIIEVCPMGAIVEDKEDKEDE